MNNTQKWLPLVGLLGLVAFLGWMAFSMVPPGG
jgi:hypothetical protein